LQHGLRAREGRVIERGAVDGTEDGLLFLCQCARRTGEERRGKEFDVSQIVGLDDFAAQTGAAVGDGVWSNKSSVAFSCRDSAFVLSHLRC
jgi:hypothetical protein